MLKKVRVQRHRTRHVIETYTEQQLHLESIFFVWDLCIDLQGGRRMDGSPCGGLKEPERS